ncbi:MAG: peptide chain release factor N(5)-glutamine methyltransferase [Candidatus Scalindua sp. AMX11]|nr:MAG: peptide chain release factor N(5)-glutamine methyltransferase [Candidatus Scalindua sp.]NOG82589.1 peptide chain release factor N(5)-glutamine methyltransferase [Planctomycetota bacterium]RZV78335.1 MAG: peptide chain release factor N(5)-glutamine methyltransferase [Candidatus Scalindua sp. SCAELEC01]TDE65115.1 MAG: peptide chain release factor N(5)-glutamine methyltransferase [Candidatus Scalindua sp. AMX11]GJQ59534.1 MAG: release factor glutamine methyltransferase [Candidatus Scalindu
MTRIQDPETIRTLLSWAVSTLKRADIEYPQSDAATLLSHALSCDRVKLYADPDVTLQEIDIITGKKLITQRARRVPLQYITGHTEFMSRNFSVDKRVLIPRPETEVLVERALDMVKSGTLSKTGLTIIDIGTGSGIIAISLAIHLTTCRVYASDISKESLEVAAINVKNLEVSERVNLFQGDLFDAFDGKLCKGSVDLVVSNPPYVTESELSCLEPEVRDHEPVTALVAGEVGLYYLKRIVNGSPEWLRPGGYLILEIGETQAEQVAQLMVQSGTFAGIKIFQDLQKRDRIVSARRR